jgi:CHAT domain-containing protein
MTEYRPWRDLLTTAGTTPSETRDVINPFTTMLAAARSVQNSSAFSLPSPVQPGRARETSRFLIDDPIWRNYPRLTSYVTDLYTEALEHRWRGDDDAFEQAMRRVGDVTVDHVGTKHPLYAQTLYNEAWANIAAGRFEQAWGTMVEAGRLDDAMVGELCSISCEADQIDLLAHYWERLCRSLSLALQCGTSPRIRREAFERVLHSRAISMLVLAARRNSLLADRYPEHRALLTRWRDLRMRVAHHMLKEPGERGAAEHEAYERQLKDLRAEQAQLEHDVILATPGLNREFARAMDSADSSALAHRLQELHPGSALVEFVRFELFDAQADRPWQAARYVAFVMHAGDPDSVALIDLAEAEPIDNQIQKFGADLGKRRDTRNLSPNANEDEEEKEEEVPDKALDDLRQVGGELRAAIFDRLAAALGPCRRVFIVPDGDLARLPFEALPLGDSDYLIDAYTFSYLSTGRDILTFGLASAGQPTEALVAAAPNFSLGAPPEVAPAAKGLDNWQIQALQLIDSMQKAQGFLADINQRLQAPKGPEPADVRPELRALYRLFLPLPFSVQEGRRIAEILGVTPLIGDDVREGWLKQCRSPQVLHLATHGFFLTDQIAFGRLARGLQHPLLRSGLALAGANTWLRGEAEANKAEEGILTAMDVSALDLVDTELVVLSACETGLGEIHRGEGVLGLRRAVAIAGARTLIMSLWCVEDLATQRLMVAYYQALQNGAGRAEALRTAQLGLKADKEHPHYRHPYYWAAFICQGDPAPLP